MNKTILIVDDEEDILDLIDYTLASEGYDTITCVDTSNVQSILDEEEIALILMDRNLPGIEGSAFIAKMRTLGYNQPVIYISAKDLPEDIIDGLDSGGDDYITKPFDIGVLKARVKSLIRRTTKSSEILKFKDTCYTPQNKTFTLAGKDLKLTTLEHDLLLEFLKNPNILLSRETLLENVWGDSQNKQPKTVNVAIKRLKESIDPSGTKEYIKAVRGEGYTFC